MSSPCAASPSAKTRQGRRVDHILAHESLAETPGQPARRGGILEQHRQKVISCERAATAEHRLFAAVVPRFGQSEAAADDRPAGEARAASRTSASE